MGKWIYRASLSFHSAHKGARSEYRNHHAVLSYRNPFHPIERDLVACMIRYSFVVVGIFKRSSRQPHDGRSIVRNTGAATDYPQ
jgi:hypothetical protein